MGVAAVALGAALVTGSLPPAVGAIDPLISPENPFANAEIPAATMGSDVCLRDGAFKTDTEYRLILRPTSSSTEAWSLTIENSDSGECIALSNAGAPANCRWGPTFEITQGATFQTPVLNNPTGTGLCLKDVTGAPPAIPIVGQIGEARVSVPLSVVAAPEEKSTPNYILASHIWRRPGKAQDVYVSRQGHEPTRGFALFPSSIVPRAAGPERTRAEARVRQNLLAPAFSSVVRLHVEVYKYLLGGSHVRGGLSKCTGFFIADRLIATAAHCVRNNREFFLPERSGPAFDRIENCVREPDPARKESTTWNTEYDEFTMRGFLRPADTGASGESRSKAPELQRLEPIVVGDLGCGQQYDFAILYVLDHEQRERPAAPRITAKAFDQDQELFLLGYPINTDQVLKMRATNRAPAEFPLTAVYDDQCRAINHPLNAAVMLHGCDTDKTNSGSPVFRRDLSAIGAIHVAGFSPPDDGCEGELSGAKLATCRNSAVPLSNVREVLVRIEEDLARKERTGGNLSRIDVLRKDGLAALRQQQKGFLPLKE